MKDALLQTLPSRAMVAGLVIKAVAFILRLILAEVPTFVGVVDTVASVAIAAGGGYVLFCWLAFAKRRLLSRVDPPVSLSGWIDCGGFSGLLVYTTDRGRGATGRRAITAELVEVAEIK